jgi:hypothetical protein
MSSPGSPTLTIDIAARRGERCVAAATLAMFAIALLSWNLASPRLAVAGAAFAIATLGGFLFLGWIGGGRRLTRVTCQPDGRWVLHEANGRTTAAELASASRISSRALWLCWCGRTLKPLLLLRSDLPPADFRRLLVRLRVAPFPRDEPQDAT